MNFADQIRLVVQAWSNEDSWGVQHIYVGIMDDLIRCLEVGIDAQKLADHAKHMHRVNRGTCAQIENVMNTRTHAAAVLENARRLNAKDDETYVEDGLCLFTHATVDEAAACTIHKVV